MQSHKLIPLDGTFQIASAVLVGSEIQNREQVVRLDGERGAVMRHCLFGSAMTSEKACQGTMCQVIVLGQRQRAKPECSGNRANSRLDGK